MKKSNLKPLSWLIELAQEELLENYGKTSQYLINAQKILDEELK